MGDIAAIFHWGPEVLNSMSLEEIVKWHRIALDRWKLMNSTRP